MHSQVTLAALAGLLTLSVWCGIAPAAGQRDEISREELQARLAGPDAPLVLDVRTAEEFAAGHVPGAVNIPHEQTADRLEELRPYQDREIVLYCKSGRRAGIAADTLAEAGFSRLRHLAGDMPGWSAAGLPVESSPDALSP
jgi:rhodanese-related sulfurtransferase